MMETIKKKYQTADPILYQRLKEFAAANRKNQTEAESIIWEYIKGQALGVKFRRQHIIGCFIADFFCSDLNLIIEIDGEYHQLPEQQISDKEREDWLNGKGYSIIRFKNEEIFSDIDNVINIIKKTIWKQKIK